MSSATSTDDAQPKPARADEGLEPWQFFVLASLICATVVTVIVRGQSATAVILLSILMGTVCLVGMAMLRTVQPLVSADEDKTAMAGHRTRAALEREKIMTLRAIKELEFDRAMGKLSDGDWQEMSARLRSRAAGLIRQLDAGAGYRDQILRDVEKRLAEAPRRKPQGDAAPATGNFCTECGTKNEGDAKFCKNCGHKL
jgi:hypothetical protein